MSEFYTDSIFLLDTTEELAKLDHVDQKAKDARKEVQKADEAVDRLEGHMKMTFKQAVHIFTAGYRMVENLLNMFGISIPPVINAIVSGMNPLISAIGALGTAETALGNIFAGIAVAMAVTSMISGMMAAQNAEDETARAIQQGRQFTQSILSFSNSWRNIY